MIRKLLYLTCLAVIGLALPAASSAGFDYGFYDFTHTNATNEAIGEAQLKLTISDAGAGNVSFQFSNTGASASAITGIYFDDRAAGGLFSTAAAIIANGTGTSFYNASSGNLSGGSTVGFSATRRALAYTPTTSNGVNPNEMVGLTLSLATGKVFNDVISTLQSTALRIGIRMSGFAIAGGESFLNNASANAPPPPPPPPVVPEPSSLVLAATALVGLAIARCRRMAT